MVNSDAGDLFLRRVSHIFWFCCSSVFTLVASITGSGATSIVGTGSLSATGLAKAKLLRVAMQKRRTLDCITVGRSWSVRLDCQ